MPIGVLTNVASVVIGGLLGSLLSNKISDTFKNTMTMVFGFCSLAMGISSVILMRNMPAVIFSVILGTMIGLLLDLQGRILRGAGKILSRLNLGDDLDEGLLLTALVLFCASGTGIFGSLTAGMTGDHSILLAKSLLDLFTALIFACNLKKATCLIGIPQLIILGALFFSARLIYPLTSDVMIDDFKAVGGVVLLATGFNILKVKEVPLADMIPAMVLAMPLSSLWTKVILPLF